MGSRTETLGWQTIRPKPGPSPDLRNRLRRLQGATTVLPQLATETTARASEPWCLRHRTCKAGAFSHGFWQTAAFLGSHDHMGLGTSLGLVGKGSEIVE